MECDGFTYFTLGRKSCTVLLFCMTYQELRSYVIDHPQNTDLRCEARNNRGQNRNIVCHGHVMRNGKTKHRFKVNKMFGLPELFMDLLNASEFLKFVINQQYLFFP